MPKPLPQGILRNASLSIAGAAFLCVPACRKSTVTATSPAETPGQSVVFDSMSKTVDAATIQAIRWQDISPTVESCARNRLTEETLKASEAMTEEPVIYLRGLLKFTQSDMTGAAAEWAKLEPSRIPPDHLYAPWRLASSNKEQPNRYEDPLAKAVNDKTAGPLTRARFHCTHDRWREGLEAYLQTDPASWTPFEIRMFAALKLQAPCTHDTEVMLAGALAGGNVPKGLELEVARLVRGTPLPDKAAVAEALKKDPVLAKAALDAASRSLEIRQAFASNLFSRVLEIVRPMKPVESTDEVVMLAFLSSAKMKDTPMMEIWAEELFRRNPTPQTRKWISAIREEAR